MALHVLGKSISEWQRIVSDSLPTEKDEKAKLYGQLFLHLVTKLEQAKSALPKRVQYTSKKGVTAEYRLKSIKGDCVTLSFPDGTSFNVHRSKVRDVETGRIIPPQTPEPSRKNPKVRKKKAKRIRVPSGSGHVSLSTSAGPAIPIAKALPLPTNVGRVCSTCGEEFSPGPKHPGRITVCIPCQKEPPPFD